MEAKVGDAQGKAEARAALAEALKRQSDALQSAIDLANQAESGRTA